MAGKADTPGGLEALREGNARRILATLLERPEGVTQLELAAESSLARSTVSTLMSETLRPLLSSSLREDGERGPPPLVWSVARDAAYSVGLDIGRSHVTGAMADPYGEIVGGPLTLAMDDTLGDPERVFGAARGLLERVVGDASKCRRIAALMVGLPGVADTEHGLLVDAAAPAWTEFEVPEEIGERWPFRDSPQVLVENDANLGGLGELYTGAGKGTGSLLFIKWSTGIGSSLILDGRLWRGKSGAAGELGHLTVDPTRAERKALRLPMRSESPQCPRCGQRDCIERLAGGPSLARALGVESFPAVIELAHDEDSRRQEEARLALNTAAKLIGMAIGPALTMLNVERVVVGGIGGSDAFPFVVDSLRQGVDQTAPQRARADAEIVPSELGKDAYVVGAVLSAFRRRGADFLIEATRVREPTAGSRKGTLLAG